MSNRNFNASVITQRRANKAVAMNMLSNMKNGNPYSFNAQTSNTNISVINQVHLGNSLDVSRGQTCTTIDPGCPCPVNNTIISTPNTGWLSFLSLSNTAVGAITAINTTTYGDFVYGIAYSSSMITLYDTALNNTIPATPLLTINSNTAQFGVVTCYNKDGAVQWVTKIDVTGTGTNNIFPQSITADDSGVYIVGYNVPSTGALYTNINFYNGSLNNYTTTTPIDNSVLYNSTNSGNNFIVKYSYSGQVLWATKIEGTGSDRTFSIVNNNQNIYISGSVGSGAPCNIFEPLNNTAITTLTSTGGQYSYIVAYNKLGVLQSVTKNIGTSSISSMVINNNDLFVFSSLVSATLNIYNSNGTINPSTILYTINQNAIYTFSTNSMILIKYDISNPNNITYSSSVLLKSYDTLPPSSSSVASSITYTNNKIVIVGWFIKTLYIFNSNSNISIADSIINNNTGTNFNTYIISFDNNLNYILSDNIDSLTDNRAYTITSDNNNIYIGGFISGTAIFQSATEPDISLTSIGGNEAVIYSYNTSNNLNWITTWRSSSFENCLGLSTDNNGNLYVSGYVTGGATTDFYSADLATKLPKTTPSFSFSSINRSPIFMKYTTSGQI